jgi:hypothetical protein
MPEPVADPLIGRTISQYEIAARLGGGGMGVVYRARDSFPSLRPRGDFPPVDGGWVVDGGRPSLMRRAARSTEWICMDGTPRFRGVDDDICYVRVVKR